MTPLSDLDIKVYIKFFNKADYHQYFDKYYWKKEAWNLRAGIGIEYNKFENPDVMYEHYKTHEKVAFSKKYIKAWILNKMKILLYKTVLHGTPVLRGKKDGFNVDISITFEGDEEEEKEK